MITIGSDSSLECRSAAEQIAASLNESLQHAGALCVSEESLTISQACDLVIRLVAGKFEQWGVAVGYHWLQGDQGKRLAAELAKGVASASGLPNLGTHISLSSGHPSGAPLAEVQVGCAHSDLERLQEAVVATQVAQGLCQGLAQFWAPVTAAVVDEPPALRSEPTPTQEAEPVLQSTPAAQSEAPPPSEPRIVLYPDPVPPPERGAPMWVVVQPSPPIPIHRALDRPVPVQPLDLSFMLNTASTNTAFTQRSSATTFPPSAPSSSFFPSDWNPWTSPESDTYIVFPREPAAQPPATRPEQPVSQESAPWPLHPEPPEEPSPSSAVEMNLTNTTPQVSKQTPKPAPRIIVHQDNMVIRIP